MRKAYLTILTVAVLYPTAVFADATTLECEINATTDSTRSGRSDDSMGIWTIDLDAEKPEVSIGSIQFVGNGVWGLSKDRKASGVRVNETSVEFCMVEQGCDRSVQTLTGTAVFGLAHINRKTGVFRLRQEHSHIVGIHTVTEYTGTCNVAPEPAPNKF